MNIADLTNHEFLSPDQLTVIIDKWNNGEMVRLEIGTKVYIMSNKVHTSELFLEYLKQATVVR